MPKTFGLLAILLVSVAILLGLARQIGWSLEAGKHLDNSVDTLSKLQKDNKDLKDKLNEVKSPGFTQALIRNKLNMAKPNETVVIIPKELIDKVLSSKTPPPETKIPNWQGWLKLFLH